MLSMVKADRFNNNPLTALQQVSETIPTQALQLGLPLTTKASISVAGSDAPLLRLETTDESEPKQA